MHQILNEKEETAESRAPTAAAGLADEQEFAEACELDEVSVEIPVQEVENHVRKAMERAARARPEEYSHLDDVPVSMKKEAMTFVVVRDPAVMKYFRARGEYDGSCWACGNDVEEALVCKQRMATHSEAWETAQICMEVKADPTASRKGTYEATAQAYITVVCDPGDRAETFKVFCGQAAYVIKDMDPIRAYVDRTRLIGALASGWGMLTVLYNLLAASVLSYPAQFEDPPPGCQIGRGS